MEKIAVIIVAGGSGTRMGAELPKQFLVLDKRPILMNTIDAFASAIPESQIIVALPEVHFDLWKRLCSEHKFATEHTLCGGGVTRFESVKNALDCVVDVDFVAVHDGVRPLVSAELIARAIEMAAQKGSVVPVVKPVCSLRELGALGASRVVDRDAFREVQTPQIFRAELLKKAYEQPFCEQFTDDASVVEAMGVDVALCDGDYLNIKITNPVDMLVAQAIIASKKE